MQSRKRSDPRTVHYLQRRDGYEVAKGEEGANPQMRITAEKEGVPYCKGDQPTVGHILVTPAARREREKG